MHRSLLRRQALLLLRFLGSDGFKLRFLIERLEVAITAEIEPPPQRGVRFVPPALERELLARADAEGLGGLAGHRTVGGLRASIYNAFPADGVVRLVELLASLEREHRGAT
jgi:phosphoserine aminotransferase